MTSAITPTGLRKSFGGKAVLDGIDLEVGTPAGDLEIGIAEGTAARLAVNTGHERVLNLLESAARPGEADETVEARPHFLRRHHLPPLLTPSGAGERRATMIISQSRPVTAATGLRRLASAIERAGGEDTGSEGASR